MKIQLGTFSLVAPKGRNYEKEGKDQPWATVTARALSGKREKLLVPRSPKNTI